MQAEVLPTDLQMIRDDQRATWDEFAPGWKKWDEWVTKYLADIGAAMLRGVKPAEGDNVLDVATGAGEPGLTIATMIGSGKVIGQDISEGMLAVARESAVSRGISNYETVACDVSELPFADDTFDVVSCRLGFMFFPDMELAAREMLRVLKPGGRFATAVWGPPEKNFWVTGITGPMNALLELPPPPPGAPGMFRCSDGNAMKELMLRSGFSNVSVTEINGSGEAESVEFFWSFMKEVAAQIVRAMSDADEQMKKRIDEAVLQSFRKRYPGNGPIVIQHQALLITGTKR